MKPLYKFNKKNKRKKQKKKKIINPPSLIHPPKQGLFPQLGFEVRRTPSPPQGAYYCTYLKDPCHHNPKMKALWVGQPAEVRQRQKTALIALISKDNKTISVLLPKLFRTWGFAFHLFFLVNPHDEGGEQEQDTLKVFYCFNKSTPRRFLFV